MEIKLLMIKKDFQFQYKKIYSKFEKKQPVFQTFVNKTYFPMLTIRAQFKHISRLLLGFMIFKK